MLQNTHRPSPTLALTLIPVLQSSLTDPATLNVIRHANQGGAVFILEKYTKSYCLLLQLCAILIINRTSPRLMSFDMRTTERAFFIQMK